MKGFTYQWVYDTASGKRKYKLWLHDVFKQAVSPNSGHRFYVRGQWRKGWVRQARTGGWSS